MWLHASAATPTINNYEFRISELVFSRGARSLRAAAYFFQQAKRFFPGRIFGRNRCMHVFLKQSLGPRNIALFPDQHIGALDDGAPSVLATLHHEQTRSRVIQRFIALRQLQAVIIAPRRIPRIIPPY